MNIVYPNLELRFITEDEAKKFVKLIGGDTSRFLDELKNAKVSFAMEQEERVRVQKIDEEWNAWLAFKKGFLEQRGLEDNITTHLEAREAWNAKKGEK